MKTTTINYNIVDFKRGTVDEIDIDDIAHSLSLQNRFNGHTYLPYSVAQHSCLVSQVVSSKNALWGLLHDAAETYVGDIISPIKTPNQVAVEIEFLKLISEKFGLSLPVPHEVKIADKRMVATEICSPLVFNKPSFAAKYYSQYKPFNIRIKPWDWAEAKQKFLETFVLLKKIHK